MADEDMEILTEHFGYPPVALMDDIINSVNIIAESALMSIEQGLLKSPPTALGFRKSKKTTNPDGEPEMSIEERARLEIETGTHKLETLLCSAIDKNFDIFELYVMKNILCIRPEDRPYFRLKHYEGLDFEAANSADAPTPEGIAELRRKLQASTQLGALLEAENAQNEVLLETLDGLISQTTAIKTELDSALAAKGNPGALAFLAPSDSLSATDSQQPLTTSTKFALSQLPALRELLATLRELNTQLEKSHDEEVASGEIRAPNKTWRKDRMNYVEEQTRKHFERVRGLELDEQGSVKDGEWLGSGRQVPREEVKGLESLLSLIDSDMSSSELLGALGGDPSQLNCLSNGENSAHTTKESREPMDVDSGGPVATEPGSSLDRSASETMDMS